MSEVIKAASSCPTITKLARACRPRSVRFRDLVAIYGDKHLKELKALEQWRWVRIDDLVACLRDSVGLASARSLWDKPAAAAFRDAHELMTRFGIVSREHEHGEPRFTWIAQDSCAIISRIPPPVIMHPESTYIPERWAYLILEFYGQGIRRLTLRPIKGAPPASKASDIIAQMHDGQHRWLHWQGGDNYKLRDLIAEIAN